MTCRYCRYLNSDAEHRCRRCGQPLADPFAVATKGAVAAAPQPARVPSQPEVPAAKSVPARPPRQAQLFGEPPWNKVIPFESFTTAPAEPAPKPKPKAAPRNPRPRASNEAQPSLDFLQPAPPAPRKLNTTVEAVIYCDAPVAAPMHRACAAVIDCSMILIAWGMFLLAVYLLDVPWVFDKVGLAVLAVSGVLVAGLYGFLWALSGGTTVGMRTMRLTLINFDGFPPDDTSRWRRYLGTMLSICAGGLGILWALADEESLAWHDHISKTFPTFRGGETNFVRHR